MKVQIGYIYNKIKRRQKINECMREWMGGEWARCKLEVAKNKSRTVEFFSNKKWSKLAEEKRRGLLSHTESLLCWRSSGLVGLITSLFYIFIQFLRQKKTKRAPTLTPHHHQKVNDPAIENVWNMNERERTNERRRDDDTRSRSADVVHSQIHDRIDLALAIM